VSSAAGGTCADGDVLATLANGTSNVFVYNHLISDQNGSSCTLTVALDGVGSIPPSSTATRIDEGNANPKRDRGHGLSRLPHEGAAANAGGSLNAGMDAALERVGRDRAFCLELDRR
jgi:hypothetical protein